VGDPGLIEHLDAYSAPRLVEYWDPDPCPIAEDKDELRKSAGAAKPMALMEMSVGAMRSRGVTIEARYTVGEYDILILSARESHGLERWLAENGYRIPTGASRVLASYIRQGMKF